MQRKQPNAPRRAPSPQSRTTRQVEQLAVGPRTSLHLRSPHGASKSTTHFRRDSMSMRLNKTPTPAAQRSTCAEQLRSPPPLAPPPSHVTPREDTATLCVCGRRENEESGRPRCLIVADTEILHLAVAEVAACHDVELAGDAARDVLCVQLRLPLQLVAMSHISSSPCFVSILFSRF